MAFRLIRIWQFCLVFSLGWCISLSAMAQTDEDETESPSSEVRTAQPLSKSPPPTGRNAVGASFGAASGVGVSYRRYVTDMLALRADGIVLASAKFRLFSVGLTLQEDAFRTHFVRIYGAQGVSLHGFTSEGPSIAVGGGFGIEYDMAGLRRGLSFRSELLLTGIFRGADGLRLLTPLPQAGIAYIF